MGIYLVVLIFIVPFGVAMYVWRQNAPPRKVYFMVSSVSAFALVMLVLGGEIINTFMGLGLFLASTSFFTGAYCSGLMPGRRKEKD